MRKLIYGLVMLGWIPTLAVVTGARWIAGDAVAASGADAGEGHASLQYFLDRHGASRRQLVITLAGESEVAEGATLPR